MASIANTIDLTLRRRHMSRRDLARKAGIPTSTLQSAMERDKNYSVEMLQKICAALDIPCTDIIPKSIKKSDTCARIKAMRQEKGITQQELAVRLGVSQSAIGQIESGLRCPKIETIDRFAKALDVSPDYLLGMGDGRKAQISQLETERDDLIEEIKELSDIVNKAREIIAKYSTPGSKI